MFLVRDLTGAERVPCLACGLNSLYMFDRAGEDRRKREKEMRMEDKGREYKRARAE